MKAGGGAGAGAGVGCLMEFCDIYLLKSRVRERERKKWRAHA